MKGEKEGQTEVGRECATSTLIGRKLSGQKLLISAVKRTPGAHPDLPHTHKRKKLKLNYFPI